MSLVLTRKMICYLITFIRIKKNLIFFVETGARSAMERRQRGPNEEGERTRSKLPLRPIMAGCSSLPPSSRNLTLTKVGQLACINFLGRAETSFAVLTVLQRWTKTKRWALGCEKYPPGPAWLLLSETGPPFSGFLKA